MKSLNIPRLILAGMVSGVIIYFALFIANGVILSREWGLWKVFADRVFQMTPEGLSLVFWAAQAAITGVAGTFIYAAIRRWIGVNLRAAYVSALLVWSTGWLGMSFDKLAFGIEPARMIYYNLLAALLGCLTGQFAAAYIYKDKPEVTE